jgi:hypothetical protein
MPESDDELLFADDSTPALREARAAIKRLKAKDAERDSMIAQLQAEADRAKALDRELMFAKAGVPAGDEFASYFSKGYDGETTIDAIRDAWTKLRGTTTEPPGTKPHDAASAQEQQTLRDEIARGDQMGTAAGGPDLSPNAAQAYDVELAAAAAKGPEAIMEVVRKYGR